MGKNLGCNLNSRFASIRKLVIRGQSEEAIDLLKSLQIDILDNRASLLQVIELQNTQPAPVNKRYLEVVDADGSTHRLTIAAKTGRVTLKIAKKASEKVREELVKFATQAMKEELEAVSYRGKIKFHKGAYVCCLQSESKRFSKTLRMEVK